MAPVSRIFSKAEMFYCRVRVPEGTYCVFAMYVSFNIYIYIHTHLYYIYIHSHTDEVHIYPAGGRKRTLLRLWLPLRKWLETRHNAIRCISRFIKIWATTRTVCPRRHVPIYLHIYIIIYIICIIMYYHAFIHWEHTFCCDACREQRSNLSPEPFQQTATPPQAVLREVHWFKSGALTINKGLKTIKNPWFPVDVPHGFPLMFSIFRHTTCAGGTLGISSNR